MQSEKLLSQKVVTKLLTPALGAIEAIKAGTVERAHLEALQVMLLLPRLAGRHGVRLPPSSPELAAIADTLAGAFNSGTEASLDDEQLCAAVQWLKILRNQLGFARPSTLLAVIDDLALMKGLQEMDDSVC